MIAAFGVTSFLGFREQYMWPLLVTSRNEMRMVQVGINSLQDADSMLSMGLSLASVALVFLFGHRQLVEGMMAGAVKG